MSTSRNVGGSLVLLAGTIVIMLVAVETALHVVNYPPPITELSQFLQFDSLRGWRNIPNAHGDYVGDEYAHSLSYNSLGFRGAEHPFATPRKTVRVVLVGDSFIDAYSVAQNDRVSEALERDLNGRGAPCHFEVIPLGTAGYSTDQELVVLQNIGLRFHPDATVLFFYYNDVWYNTQSTYIGTPKPLFQPTPDSLAAGNVPLRPRKGDEMLESGTPHGLIQQLKAHSKIYRLAERVAKRYSPLRNIALRVGLMPAPPETYTTVGNSHDVPVEFGVFRTTESPQVQAAWQMTDRLLGQMNTDVRREKGQFLVFYVPFRPQVYPDAARGGAPQLSTAGWDLGRVSRNLLEICAHDALSCIEPTATYRTAADSMSRESQRLYYALDQHWNANGHALAARILAERLLADETLTRRCADVGRASD